MHIEYLQNMNVGATMTISLIQNDELWGLIACHHETTKYPSHQVRNLCNFLGAFFSRELYHRKQLDEYRHEVQINNIANRIKPVFLLKLEDALTQLEEMQKDLLEMIGASGFAISYQGKSKIMGDTPNPDQIQSLAKWLAHRALDHVYHSSSLSLQYPAASDFVPVAADNQDYMMWFRPVW